MRRFVLAFVGGVCAVQTLPAWPTGHSNVVVGVALAGLALLCTWWCRRRPIIIAVCSGLLWAGWHAQLGLAARLPAALDGASFALDGIVRDLPINRAGARHFELELRAVARGRHAGPALRRVALADYGHELGLAAGTRCILHARLRTPRGTHNPAGVDRERMLFARRIDATGYVIAHSANRCLPRGVGGALDRLRARLAQAIGASVGDDATGGVLRALGVGERTGMSERQWQVLQATGTTHVVSISGLHVSMVALVGGLLGRVLWSLSPALTRRVPAPSLGAGVGLATAGAYALLAGFTVPTQRTLLMLGCLWWQRRRGQRLLNADGLVLALGVVVLCDPLAVLTASCWLSFGAMAALVGASALLRDGALLTRLLGMHLWLAFALAPLLAFVTPFLAWTSPLANLVVVPLVTWVVVPLVLGGIVLALSGLPLADACWQLAGRIWEFGWSGLEILADSAPAWRLPHAVSPAAALLVVFGLILLWLPLGRARVWLVPLLGLSPWLAAPAPPAHGTAWVNVLDVGQGLAVLVRTRSHALLYDAGPRGRGGGDAGKSVVLPNLRAWGVWRLDRLVLSHADIDHAGGADAVLAGVHVAALMLSPRDPRDPGATSATRCRAGQAWAWDAVRFEVLHPASQSAGDDNQLSCVLRITSAGGRRVLLTGDIDTSAEHQLLAGGANLAADVLLAPHHGSAGSSSPAFVTAVRPRHVVHTAAFGNRYGFPAAAVRERYAAFDTVQHVTGEHGAVLFELGHGPIAWTRWRTAFRRYWHARVTAAPPRSLP